MMESSSPLSLFEAVFKVIEERVPFGRLLVTITSGLMMASLIVFCVGYLVNTLSAAANWIILSLRAKSFMPFPQFSPGKGVFFSWYSVVFIWVCLGLGLTSYVLFKIGGGIDKNNAIIEKLDQNNAIIEEIEEKLNQNSALIEQISHNVTPQKKTDAGLES